MLKLLFLHVHKVFYFSDGSGVQYKNFKNFTNLLLHEQDFDLKAEWHWQNACDGVDVTMKCLATHASLEKPILNQILTPLQLFEFANAEIHGVTSFSISTEHVDHVALFLTQIF